MFRILAHEPPMPVKHNRRASDRRQADRVDTPAGARVDVPASPRGKTRADDRNGVRAGETPE